MEVSVLNSKPTNNPETFPAISPKAIIPIGNCSGLEARLVLKTTAVTAVKIRPWFYAEGYWWGTGVDANPPGTAALTADPANKNGNGQPYGHGRFIRNRTATHACLVLESGNLADIEKAFLDGAVFND